jgi:hypothetical protein
LSLRHYVYYRVAAADVAAAVAAVIAAQAVLRARHRGLWTECLRRSGEREGHVTLMEVYGFADGHDAASIEAEAAAASGRWRQGERHIEAFVVLG